VYWFGGKGQRKREQGTLGILLQNVRKGTEYWKLRMLDPGLQI